VPPPLHAALVDKQQDRRHPVTGSPDAVSTNRFRRRP
jgi:hypothetical protein